MIGDNGPSLRKSQTDGRNSPTGGQELPILASKGRYLSFDRTSISRFLLFSRFFERPLVPVFKHLADFLRTHNPKVVA
jgi:hypothetical protein